MRPIRFALTLAACLLWSQVTLPDTPAGRRFGEWLEVFNSGERARVQQFFEKYGDPARVDRALAMRQQTGGFELQKVEESSATKIAGVMNGRAGGRSVHFSMEVEPAEPHRIAAMELRPAAASPRSAPPTAAPRMTETEALAALRAELDQRVSQDR